MLITYDAHYFFIEQLANSVNHCCQDDTCLTKQ